MATLPQVPQVTRADQAVVILREAILSGDLQAGTPLREVQLAEDLAVGRGPLREALLRLEEEGLVKREPFRGSYVAEVSIQTISEIEELRTFIEPHAALLALKELRSGPGHQALTDAVVALEQAVARGDDRAGIEAHMAVHRSIYAAANNAVLLGIWSSWQNQMRLFMALEHRRFDGYMPEVAASHRHLLTTIESGDKRAIRRAFAEHIRPETVLEDFEQMRQDGAEA